VISSWLIAIRGPRGRRFFCLLVVNLIVPPFRALVLSCNLHRRDPSPLGFVMQPMCAKITSVLRHDYPGQACSLAKSLEVIGERWSLLIVRDVMNGNRRFSGIQSSLGIARNVLSARLQRLVDENILERRAYQESPPRHEYFLTEKGLDLWPSLLALMHWGDRHSAGPEGAPLIVIHKDCGGTVSDRGICESCGEVLSARDATAVPGPGAAAYEGGFSPFAARR
jgi:DNA-binding HxlR family transcriptional regulator